MRDPVVGARLGLGVLDIAVCAIGPGIVGTASRLGHGGLAAVTAANAALALGGRPVIAARVSEADERERHRGVSHHTRAVLELCLGEVAVGEDGEGWREACDGLPLSHMGRGPDDDPAFFAAAFAAGKLARELLGTVPNFGTVPKRTVYDGTLFDVTVEEWNGREREIVEHPGAVCIVPVDRDGYVTLVRQLREATGGELLEIPAGTREPGEEPLQTARRELAEETGLTGGEWHEVTAFWTTPGFTRERMTLFFAEGVEPGEASPEEDESFELVRWPVAEIESRLGEIEDAKSLVGSCSTSTAKVSAL